MEALDRGFPDRRQDMGGQNENAVGRSSPKTLNAGAARPRRCKTLHRVASFPTTADAMTAESVCRELGISGRIIPLPGTIRADCGLAWLLAPGTLEAFKTASEGKFTISGVYEVMMYEVRRM